eukprot:6138278-Prymnesium_polylepis.1
MRELNSRRVGVAEQHPNWQSPFAVPMACHEVAVSICEGRVRLRAAAAQRTCFGAGVGWGHGDWIF